MLSRDLGTKVMAIKLNVNSHRFNLWSKEGFFDSIFIKYVKFTQDKYNFLKIFSLRILLIFA